MMSYPVAAVRAKTVPKSFEAAQTYREKVLSYSPYAYWMLAEAAGLTANCEVDSGQDGTYNGVTLGQTGVGDGNTCPLFDGINDDVDIDTATLVSNFSGTEGSIICFMKVYNAGVWTDATGRDMFDLRANSSNYVRGRRSTTNNQIPFIYRANGEIDGTSYNGLSSTGWIHFAVTWSDSSNAAIFYMDGANKVSTAANSTFAGSLATAAIGSKELGSSFWYGYLAHVALWDSVLSDADVADLASV